MDLHWGILSVTKLISIWIHRVYFGPVLDPIRIIRVKKNGNAYNSENLSQLLNT